MPRCSTGCFNDRCTDGATAPATPDAKAAARKATMSDPAHNERVLELVVADAGTLRAAMNGLPAGREKSLALTKLDECLLWAREAVRVAAAVPPPAPSP